MRCSQMPCSGSGVGAGRSGIASTDSDGSSRCCLTRRHQDGPRRTPPCVLSGALAGAVERTVYPDAMQWLWTWRRTIRYRQHVLRRQLSELQALSCRRCEPPTCRGTGLDAGRSGIASTDSDGSSVNYRPCRVAAASHRHRRSMLVSASSLRSADVLRAACWQLSELQACSCLHRACALPMCYALLLAAAQ